MKLLLFDIDGTLLLSGGAGKVSFNKTFKDLFGIEDAWRNIDPGGKTDYLIIQELATLVLKRELTMSEYHAVCKSYLSYFKDDLYQSENFRLMPGVKELLFALKDQPVLLGLATGNLEDAGWEKLKYAGLDHFFSFGGFGSDAVDRVGLTQKAMERGLEQAEMPIAESDIYVIGDTIYDVGAGKALGLQTLAVATGSHDLETLRSHEPDHLLENFDATDLVLKCFKF